MTPIQFTPVYHKYHQSAKCGPSVKLKLVSLTIYHVHTLGSTENTKVKNYLKALMQ